jgi:hypothetical protein
MFRQPFYGGGPYPFAHGAFPDHNFRQPIIEVHNYGPVPAYNGNGYVTAAQPGVQPWRNPRDTVFIQQLPRQPMLKRGVRVILPDMSSAIVEERCLHEHLPRTRNYTQCRIFVVEEFLPEWMFDSGNEEVPDTFPDNMRVLFRKLEEYSTTNQTDIFDRALLLVQNLRADPQIIFSCHAYVISLLTALDNDRGFGCSDTLADHVINFLDLFFPKCQLALGSQEAVRLFLALGKVFRPSSPKAIEKLANIWQGLDLETQQAIQLSLLDRLPGAALAGNVTRLVDGLRVIGVMGA